MAYVKIEIKNLSKHYENMAVGTEKKIENRSKKNVIDHMNLKIYSHEFICVLGHSGCGKSTLPEFVSRLY